ncbi:MAG: hypothetical protein K6C34_00695 [Alphaproteobacteria bacterium]|nr:hypothetical protein [Alphaproteobacteria bacterium]
MEADFPTASKEDASRQKPTEPSDDQKCREIQLYRDVVLQPIMVVDLTDPITQSDALRRAYTATFPGKKYSEPLRKQEAILALKEGILKEENMKERVLPLLQKKAQ